MKNRAQVASCSIHYIRIPSRPKTFAYSVLIDDHYACFHAARPLAQIQAMVSMELFDRKMAVINFGAR